MRKPDIPRDGRPFQWLPGASVTTITAPRVLRADFPEQTSGPELRLPFFSRTAPNTGGLSAKCLRLPIPYQMDDEPQSISDRCNDDQDRKTEDESSETPAAHRVLTSSAARKCNGDAATGAFTHHAAPEWEIWLLLLPFPPLKSSIRESTRNPTIRFQPHCLKRVLFAPKTADVGSW
jgi:hypothetical protein